MVVEERYYIQEDELLNLLGSESVSDITLDKISKLDKVIIRHAYWKKYNDSSYVRTDSNGEAIFRRQIVYRCSYCGRRTVIKERYCPSCGSVMDSNMSGGC